MGAGTPLDDGDRAPWLRDIGAFLGGAHAGAVVSCSALKRRYREQLRAAAGAPVLFAHLTADEASISARR
jgi:gluconokinase